MKNETTYEKRAARIMAANNREAVSVFVRARSAKDIIILQDKHGVDIMADD